MEEIILTKELFREDSYLKSCTATVTLVDNNTVCVDQTIFYPLGGGQPGDTGTMVWDAGSALIIDTRNSPEGIRHVLEDTASVPPEGTSVELNLDWLRARPPSSMISSRCLRKTSSCDSITLQNEGSLNLSFNSLRVGVLLRTFKTSLGNRRLSSDRD